MHNLVAIELAYINTKHPDFTDAAQVSASVNSQQVVISLYVEGVPVIIYSATLSCKAFIFTAEQHSPLSSGTSDSPGFSLSGGGPGWRKALEE